MWRSVRLRLPSGQYAGQICDLSLSGACVRLDPGTRLAVAAGSRLCISIPLVPEFLEVEATVRHVTDGAAGVEFEDLSSDAIRGLNSLLEEERFETEVVVSHLASRGRSHSEEAR